MKESQLHDALGELSEEIIMPVAALRAKKRYSWVKWVAMAACLCLILSFPFVWRVSSENAVADGIMEAAPDIEYGYLADKSASGSVSADSFAARVLEVHDTYLMVSPLEGEKEQSSADRIEVSLAKLSEVPDIAVGDTVRVYYSGMLEEIYPARASGVWKIEVIE